MSAYAIIFWVMAAVASFSPEVVALSLFICTAAFGALNILPDNAASANLLPQSAAAVIFVVRMLYAKRSRHNMLAAATNWRGLMLLLIFIGYACLTAVALPTLFAGRVEVIPLNDIVLNRLGPTTANVDQCAYLLANAGAALALFTYLKLDPTAERRQALMYALIASGCIFILSGLLDYSGAFADLVASFKTTTYRMFLESEIENSRRITGFFSEAAAYGAPCLQVGAILFFSRSAFGSSLVRNWICPIVACALIGLAALSTSSTALVGVFMFAALIVWRVVYRLARGQSISNLRVEMAILGFLVLLLGLVAVLTPAMLEAPITLLNAVVLKKAETTSYRERGHWNRVALDALWGTYGIGVGAGGARTSNWAYAVLSNTGFLGFGVIAAFLVILFTRPLSKLGGRTAAMATGAKYTLMVFLTTEVVSGTTVDPGMMLGILAAMIAAGSQWSEALSPQKRRSPAKSKKHKSRRRRSSVSGPVTETAVRDESPSLGST